jgi:hypothetical protein
MYQGVRLSIFVVRMGIVSASTEPDEASHAAEAGMVSKVA